MAERINPKTRGNYAQGVRVDDEKWLKIFGHTKAKATTDEGVGLRYKLDFFDNPNAKRIYSIGQEIKRMKQLDGINPSRIEKYFGKDANACHERKIDPQLIKNITRDIVVGLKEAKRRR